MSEIEDLIERMEQFERDFSARLADIERRLRAAARPYEPMSPDERRVFFRAQAARARAAKSVGKGRGSVSPQARARILRQLERDAGGES